MSFRIRLWALLLSGLVIRVLFTLHTHGNVYDLGSLALVARALVTEPGHVYEVANVGGVNQRWPYPPGYFPVVMLVHALGGNFSQLIRIPPALTDLAIAWVLQDHLRFQGATDRTRLGAAALVALGPSFIAISGVHGQIDSVGILPALIGVSLWCRWADGPKQAHRAWVAGLLIGLGADIKVVPALMVFALLPSARSWRERLALLIPAAAVPALSLAPFVVARGTSMLTPLLKYHGGSGLGGIGLLAEPGLATDWFHQGLVQITGLSSWLQRHGGVIAIVAILVCAAVLYRRRVPPAPAACLIWLTVYVFGVQFFMQYMVWGLTYFIFAGYRRASLALQLLLFFPVLITYRGAHHPWQVDVLYIAPMLIVWALELGALTWLWRRATKTPQPGRGPAPRAEPAT